MTAFKVNAEYRRQGWGTQMMQKMLNLPRYKDRPIVVEPAPYGGDIGSEGYRQEIENLKEMYKKFGFENSGNEYMNLPERNSELV